MKKYLAMGLVGALIIGIGVGVWSTGAFLLENKEEPVVNIYNWPDYIDESVLDAFEKEYNIRVVYDTFDSNDLLEAKLLAGNTGYDVVVPRASFFARQIEAGVYQPLKWDWLSNRDNLWDVISKRLATFDPGNRYGVNYMWGTTGIGYVREKILERMPDAPLNSWRMVFDSEVVSKFADCGVYFLDASDDMIPAALNYLGEDPNSLDPEVLAKAEAVLTAVRPYVRKFHSSEYINGLANGDICLAIGWSGDVFQARDRADEAGNGVTVGYSIPKEGAQMWFDVMGIPADAPHPNNAHLFINYMMRAEVMAKVSNHVMYPNGNKASQKFLDAEVIGDSAIYPPEEVMRKLYTTKSPSADVQRLITRLWTRVTSGR